MTRPDAASSLPEHCIVDYTGGPEGQALIVAHCRCGKVSAECPTLDEADADLQRHVPEPPPAPLPDGPPHLYYEWLNLDPEEQDEVRAWFVARPDPCMTMPPDTDYPSAVWVLMLLRGEKKRASCPIDCDDSTASCIHRGMSDDEVALLGRTRSIRSEWETGRG